MQEKTDADTPAATTNVVTTAPPAVKPEFTMWEPPVAVNQKLTLGNEPFIVKKIKRLRREILLQRVGA